MFEIIYLKIFAIAYWLCVILFSLDDFYHIPFEAADSNESFNSTLVLRL